MTTQTANYIILFVLAHRYFACVSIYSIRKNAVCSGMCMYYGHPGTNHKCPDYQGVPIFNVSLCDKAHLTKCVDYSGVLI